VSGTSPQGRGDGGGVYRNFSYLSFEKSMKVLLLEHPRRRSSIHFNDVANTPLSSCLLSGYIAAYLCQRGVDTEICDFYTSGFSLSQMVEKIEGIESDVLGVNLVYCWEHTHDILKALETIKHRKQIPIIPFGFFPTFSFKTLLEENRWIDFVIVGEPEHSFFEVVSMLQTGTDPKTVKGIAFLKKGGVVATKHRPVIEDLDALPFPIRTPDQLVSTGHTVLGSRGCYGSCTFCYINNFYGVKCYWRGRSPENIGDEATMLLSMVKDKYLYFVDANFFGPGEGGQLRGETIAQVLGREKGLTFGMECRVNDIQERSLKKLVGSGLRDVFLGVESGSSTVLKRMRKQTTREQTVKALKRLRNCGIEPHIGFIMFDPESDLQNIRDNFTFLTSQKLLGNLSCSVQLLYHPEIVLMGTDTYRALKMDKAIRFSPYSPYQAFCDFKDKKVAFLADCVTSVCRYLLERAEAPGSPIYWKKKSSSDGVSNRLNDWLVGFFEELLEKMSLNDMQTTPDSKSHIIKQARENIDVIMNTDNSPGHASSTAEIRA
jgi:radical SAM superfamily enzyme YgiQ (UPF0313 family)